MNYGYGPSGTYGSGLESSYSNGFGNTFGNTLGNTFGNTFGNGNNETYYSGPGIRDYSQSNTLVAKIAFLFLVLFLFVILLKVGTSILGWMYATNESPHLINGMVSGKQMQVFQQDPSTKNPQTIVRSTNTINGIEFTWSAWIYIDDLQYLQGQYRHVFSKGNSDPNSLGMMFPNNAPGVYITPNKNDLLIVMNTFNVINEEILIPDIPLNKWVHVLLRLENRNLDVYINGSIARSANLTGVPKQNYGDVFVGLNGGFDGYVSNLWYYDYALTISEINRLMKKGPNTKMVGSDMNKKLKNNYLSLRWYFNGAGNEYNPVNKIVV
jgi:hypothetical protein